MASQLNRAAAALGGQAVRIAKTFKFGTFAMLIFSAGAMFAPAAQSSASTRSPAKALSSKTRLITVDVVANDSRGNSIPG